MPDKETIHKEDLREVILKREYEKYFSSQKYENSGAVKTFEPFVKNAMDEYFTKRSMELLEYLRKNVTKIEGAHEDAFLCKDEWLTGDELFENFL